MKFHKPLFSIIVILTQLCLSIKDYYKSLDTIEKLKGKDSELYKLIEFGFTYDTLFFFIFILGFYEMTTKHNRFKIVIRIFLICIILGTQFSRQIPINDFYFAVYNTAWFSATLAFFLILIRIGKNITLKRIK